MGILVLLLVLGGCAPHVDGDDDGVTADQDCDDDDPLVGWPSTFFADADGDGFGGGDPVLGCPSPRTSPRGGDCDDLDPYVFPTAPEVCNGGDDDCDGLVDEGLPEYAWYRDDDGDGFGGEEVLACGQLEGLAYASNDCDDGDAGVYPGAEERCNGADDDCDGAVDDDAVDGRDWYEDGDGDGWGRGLPVQACEAPDGYADQAGDCDDREDGVYPGAPEHCDGEDEDCDGVVDGPTSVDASTWYRDADGDGYGDPDRVMVDCEGERGWIAEGGDCDDTAHELNPDTPWYADADGDGFGNPDVMTHSCTQPSGTVADARDCDDRTALVHPAAIEVCDGVDNDCSGTADGPESADATTWFWDGDGDGFGNPAHPFVQCYASSGMVADDRDCDDADASVNPDAVEVCGPADEDCDGLVDDDDPSATDVPSWYPDLDGDGWGDASGEVVQCAGPPAYASVAGDCDDGDEALNPGAAELCDEVDNDCDGDVDTDDADYAGLATYYADEDADGYGDPDHTTEHCGAPSGYVDNDDDCDDGDEDTNPDGTEVCGDGVDNDCDQAVHPSCRAWTGTVDAADADAVLTGDSDYVGYSVGSEDVDGDGYADLLVGAPNNDDYDTDAGAVYLLLGGASGEVDLTADADAVFTGDDEDRYLGFAATGAGDVDGDGYGDVLLGGVGVAYLVLGSSAPAGLDMGSADVALIGSTTTFGRTLAGAGDVDGDGYDDLLASDPYASSSAGETYLFLGSSSPDSSVTPSDADATLVGDSGVTAGEGISAGDTDGDGCSDLVVGAPDVKVGRYTIGAAYVVLGCSVSGSVALSSDADATLPGEDSRDEAGEAVSMTGDVDGDGYADLLVGAPGADDVSSSSGLTYLVHGPVDADAYLADAATIFEGGYSDDSGSQVCIVPDMDGDGLDEILIGADSAKHTYNWDGVAYLWYGASSPGGLQSSADAGADLANDIYASHFGWALAGVEDTDGDGLGGFLVGAYRADGGYAYAFFGGDY